MFPFPDQIDTDGDGEPDTDVDHDQDGIPDFPPENPLPADPNVYIFSKLGKGGYKVERPIKLRILTEDGNEVLLERQISNLRSGESVDFEWDIQAILDAGGTNPLENLDPQMLQVEIEFTRCFDEDFRVDVLRQGGDPVQPGCEELIARAELALGLDLEITTIQFGGTPQATRDATNGPYLVYDYINDDAPNDKPQWKKEEDEMVPVVMKMGTTVYAKANFLGVAVGKFLAVESVKATLKFANGDTTVVTNEGPINVLALPLAGMFGDVTIPIKLPNKIGRHTVSIDWEFELKDNISGKLETVKITTPSGRGHMLYSVFGDQPSITKNTGGEKAYIWYHPEHFRDRVPVSKVGEQSPLDLAVHWAATNVPDPGNNHGVLSLPAQSNIQVVTAIAKGLYENGGYPYTADTNFYNLDAEEFAFAEALKARQLECIDYQLITKIFSNYIGVPARTRRYDFPNRFSIGFNPKPSYVWTNYIKMSQVSAGGSFSSHGKNVSSDWYAPKNASPLAEAFFDDYGGSFGNTRTITRTGSSDPDHPSPLATLHFFDFVQMRFWYHEVVVVSSGSGELIVDASARGDTNFDANLNPNQYINQLNAFTPEDFEQKLKALGLLSTTVTTVLGLSKENYRERPGTDDQVPLGDTEEDYFKKLFYLSTAPKTLRESTGFNEKFPPRKEDTRTVVITL